MIDWKPVERGLIFFLDQHDNFARGLHFVVSIALSAIDLGLCQPPWAAMIRSASIGSQVFGSYLWASIVPQYSIENIPSRFHAVFMDE